MYSVRCTQALLRKLGRQRLQIGDEPATTTALGDWFARVHNRGHHRLILCTSAKSLLTVLVSAKNMPMLPTRISAAVHELLFALGAPVDQINREIHEMATARFDRTNSRTVLGSMNDMAYLADGYLEGVSIPSHLLVAEMKMAQAPCGPLEHRSPGDVALALLRGAAPADVEGVFLTPLRQGARGRPSPRETAAEHTMPPGRPLD
jgi:hypothetical protein